MCIRKNLSTTKATKGKESRFSSLKGLGWGPRAPLTPQFWGESAPSPHAGRAGVGSASERMLGAGASFGNMLVQEAVEALDELLSV